MATQQNNGGFFNWQTIISAASLLFVLFAASWTLMQTQFSNIDKSQALIRDDLQRRETEIKDQLKGIHENIDKRYVLFVPRTDYGEFQSRILDRLAALEKQIVTHIENAQPSTKELHAFIKGIEVRVIDLENRMVMRPQRHDVLELMKAHNEVDRIADAALRREIDALHKSLEDLRLRHELLLKSAK